MSVLVVDVGTSGLRAAVIRPDGEVDALHYRAFPPQSPFPGLVEFDAAAMKAAVLEVAHLALAEGGPVAAVGITAQRASTIVWHRSTGEPVGPGLGWQDLRTVLDCITAKAEHGLALAPNQSATKLAWLLNTYDPNRELDLCFGTVDTWVAWVLSNGTAHATDHTNAAVTGLTKPDASGWSANACAALNIPMDMLPVIVDTSGVFGQAHALPGAPPIAALVGDQQGSLIGQSCVQPGQAKITFGTGGMLDVVTGRSAPTSGNRTSAGTFPIVAWSRDGQLTWGAEAIMLSAGTNVEWLVSDLGVLASPAESHDVAAQCDTTDGVVYVPALMGLGTPYWDYGARGTLLGLTRGSGRPQITRAVLEGVAASMGACLELIRAAGIDPPEVIGAGGGLGSPLWAQMHADAFGIPIRLAKDHEGSARGAALLAGLGVGATPALAVETPLLSGTCVSPRLDEEAFWSRQRAWQTLLQRNALP